MISTYPQAIAKVFNSEGGYTNNPKDPGGPTNWGITLHDARTYWKSDATAEDVKRMPKSVAETIYQLHYANPIFYNSLPAGVDYSVLDYAVNSGVERAVKTLQSILGVTEDGVLGPVTLQAALAADPTQTINKIWDDRLQFDEKIKSWPIFGRGWSSRIRQGRKLALSLKGNK
jgi:lysozyme family protein